MFGHMLRVLIVDDEPLARLRLRELLADDPEVVIAGECDNGDAAAAAILQLMPDLVLLDIRMPGLDGLEVVREVGVDRMPTVVFVTAYDEYALQAFDVHALDYILKPVREERLTAVLQRAKQIVGARTGPPHGDTEAARARLAALMEYVFPPGDAQPVRYASRLAIKRDGGRVMFVPTAEIDWVEGSGNYVRVHVGADVHLVRGTLGKVASHLSPELFIRVHRSTIVNVERIQELTLRGPGSYSLRLSTGATLMVGRHYRANVDALVRRG